MSERRAHIERITKETKIVMDLNLDGSGQADIHTGIGFFDHMLNSFARHGFFDLTCHVEGDLEVDCHHTIEDTGIVLGQAIASAATVISFCPWMRRWCSLRWICPDGRIWSATCRLQWKRSADLTQRWCGSFSMRCLTALP